ncbi:hypothetical protein [Streptomyces niveus]|uniref:hypothetical protein n=1 Tax=Streptomyces niveus TaxID=193462 RepID=UPI00344503CD
MTEKRLTVNDITSDQLDALYDRLEYAAHVAADERGRAFTAERRADTAEDALDAATRTITYFDAQSKRRKAALDRVHKLATVWDDAPDPLARAMARDLHTTLNGPKEN